MSLQRKLIIIGALLGGLSVAIGAFGAHSLKALLIGNGRTETFELAVRYQFYHALALLIMAGLAEKLDGGKLYWSTLFMTAGTLVFSGSLYTLSLSGITIWGAVTPVGGVLLLLGWLFLLLVAKK